MHEQRVSDRTYLPRPEDIRQGILEELAEAGRDECDDRLERVLFTMRDLAARWQVDEATAYTVATCADAYYGGLCVTSAGTLLMQAAAVLTFEERNPEVRTGGCAEIMVRLLRALHAEAEREGYELHLMH